MKLGIEKPGQGYWVRVLTVVFAGFLILRGTVWLWLELQGIDPPVTSWSAQVGQVSGEAPAAGARVTLLVDDETAAARIKEIGTAEVRSFSQASSEFELISPTLIPGELLARARFLSVAGPDGSPAFQAQVVRVSNGDRLYEVLYVQGAAAAVALLAGAAIVFWFVGANPRSVDFLIATDGEMKKVNWSTRKDVIASTWVVIGASVLIASGLYVVDIAFSSFFQFIDVLKH